LRGFRVARHDTFGVHLHMVRFEWLHTCTVPIFITRIGAAACKSTRVIAGVFLPPRI
jgi:hypothetical protein